MTDYDINLQYQHDKFNIVPDALSKKLTAMLLTQHKEFLVEMRRPDLKVILPELEVQLMIL